MQRLDALGALLALVAMLALAGSFAVTPLLLDYPVYAAQALRYAAAGIILTGIAHGRAAGSSRVTMRELAQLAALALAGLAGFNVALVEGLRHLEPATMGAVVGASPIVLATLGPVLERRRIAPRIVVAALIVFAGAALVYGARPSSGRGLMLALLVLAGESSFSLLAVPLLPRLGPLVLSAYVTGIASAVLAVAALVQHPGQPFPLPTVAQAGALVYLALIVTVLAFVAWYASVARLGAARAGLFVGCVPVATALAAAALGTGVLTLAQILGASLVTIGLLVGASPRRFGSGSTHRPEACGEEVWSGPARAAAEN